MSVGSNDTNQAVGLRASRVGLTFSKAHLALASSRQPMSDGPMLCYQGKPKRINEHHEKLLPSDHICAFRRPSSPVAQSVSSIRFKFARLKLRTRWKDEDPICAP